MFVLEKISQVSHLRTEIVDFYWSNEGYFFCLLLHFINPTLILIAIRFSPKNRIKVHLCLYASDTEGK